VAGKAAALPGGSSATPGAAGRRARDRVLPYALVAPTLLLVLSFIAVPALYGVVISLHRVQFIRLGRFVGLQNYRDLLADPRTWTNAAVSFTFVFASVALTVVLGFALALLLNQPLVFRRTFRTIVLLPWITSYVVTYSIAKWMLNTDLGLVNHALRSLGLSGVEWLNDPTMAMASLVSVNVWRSTPYAAVLLLAGLQSLPEEIYQAAAVDGATTLRRFRALTLPLMRTPLLVILVLLTISDFNVVVAMLVLTGGGPGIATEALSVRMYNEAFVNFRMGPAASISVVIFLLNVAISAVYFRLLKAEAYA
jgi:multiple sugar transport system permease protein